MQEAAPVERERLDLLTRDDLVDRVTLMIDQGRDSFNGDDILGLPDLQGEIDSGHSPSCDLRILNSGPESIGLYSQPVAAGLKRRRAVLANLIAHNRARESSFDALHVDGASSNHCSASIINGAGDFACGCLGERDGRCRHG